MKRRRREALRRREFAPAGSGSDAPATRAKADLENARTLDQRDDGTCRDAATKVREALGRS